VLASGHRTVASGPLHLPLPPGSYLYAVVLNYFLERAKSRHTTLLESRTKKISTQVNWHVLFYSRTKSVAQNIRCVILIERLLRAAQNVIGAVCGSQDSGSKPLFYTVTPMVERSLHKSSLIKPVDPHRGAAAP